MELKRVVVTGLGAITPIGNTVSEYWSSLQRGVSGAADITRFDHSRFKTHFACEVKGYDWMDYFDRKNVRKYDLFAQFGLIAADEAIADSGMNAENTDLDEVGVIWSSGIGGLATFFDEVVAFAKGDGTPRFNPFFIPKMIADITAGHISIKHGYRGPNFATVSACASSANSLIDAYNYIRLGQAVAIVAGGSEAAVNESGVGGFNAMHAISTRNDDPATASRPFDKDRDGFVIGEGGGGLMLEELEHAKKRGAKIYAEFVGGGLSGDANHMTSPHPEGFGAVLSMRRALKDAGLKIEDVDHINTHGTSTPLGDISEPKAIVSLFGEHAYKLSINSTKSMTGHLLGGAGVVEAIATILSVQNDLVPPTINHFTYDPEIDSKLDFTFGEARKRIVNVAISNTFGFGGHNASMVLKKYIP